MNKRQAGFSVVEVIIVLAVAGLIGFGGYKVYKNNQDQTTKMQAKAVPAKIESKSDIDQATQAIDSQPIDSTLDPTQLDSDINSLY